MNEADRRFHRGCDRGLREKAHGPRRRVDSGGADTADAKLAIMEECGFTVTRNPSEMGKLLKGPALMSSRTVMRHGS